MFAAATQACCRMDRYRVLIFEGKHGVGKSAFMNHAVTPEQLSAFAKPLVDHMGIGARSEATFPNTKPGPIPNTTSQPNDPHQIRLFHVSWHDMETVHLILKSYFVLAPSLEPLPSQNLHDPRKEHSFPSRNFIDSPIVFRPITHTPSSTALVFPLLYLNCRKRQN